MRSSKTEVLHRSLEGECRCGAPRTLVLRSVRSPCGPIRPKGLSRCRDGGAGPSPRAAETVDQHDRGHTRGVDLPDLVFAVVGVGALLASLLPRVLEGRPFS